jgi:hypothetical protein
MPSSGMLRCVILVITDVSDELSAFIIRVTRIRFCHPDDEALSSCHPDDGGAKFLRNVGSYKSHTA